MVTVLFADLVGFTSLAEDRDPEQVKRLVDDAFELLVTDVESYGGVVDKVLDQRGGIDWVVCAAGVTRDRVSWKMAASEWDDVLAVNLTGAYRTIQQFLPMMRASSGHRAIVATASVQALRGTAWNVCYDASKAGVTGMVRSCAHEFGAYGITVNAIAPGPIDTRMLGVGDPPGSCWAGAALVSADGRARIHPHPDRGREGPDGGSSGG